MGKEVYQGKGTKIVSCDCKHEYQDKRYGQGKRVANVVSAKESRCTVCGKKHE